MGSSRLLLAGVAASLLFLVGAGVFALVFVLDGSSDDEATTSRPRDTAVRGEGVIRTTPQPLSTYVAAADIQTAMAGSGEIVEQETQRPRTPSAAERGERDDSADLPGTFVPSQGRGHFDGGLIGHLMTPFCTGVPHSDTSDPEIEIETVGPVNRCYLSNLPSSGEHLGVQRNVDLGGGLMINIPPDPDVYPHDIEIPRDSIPHILEHAGVFVGITALMVMPPARM